MIIPGVPERRWKASTAIFVCTLLALGLLIFALTKQGLDCFWLVWFGFVGLIASRVLLEHHWEIQQPSFEFTRTSTVLGVFPLGSKRYDIVDFDCIKRYVKCASGYDKGGDEGFYRPSIVLVKRDGSELPVQQFRDCDSNDHPLSAAWAGRIAKASGLPVVDEIESWSTSYKR